jgi:hypothetical protein
VARDTDGAARDRLFARAAELYAGYAVRVADRRPHDPNAAADGLRPEEFAFLALTNSAQDQYVW